jgi:hypothetical protein
MGTVHFLRASDIARVSNDLLAKHKLIIDEVKELNQKAGELIDQANALLDADLLAIGTDPNYKYDNGVKEKLDELKAERETITQRSELLLKRASEYLEWHGELFKR